MVFYCGVLPVSVWVLLFPHTVNKTCMFRLIRLTDYKLSVNGVCALVQANHLSRVYSLSSSCMHWRALEHQWAQNW